MDKNDFYKHIDSLNIDQLKELCIKLYDITKDGQEIISTLQKHNSFLETMLRLWKKFSL